MKYISYILLIAFALSGCKNRVDNHLFEVEDARDMIYVSENNSLYIGNANAVEQYNMANGDLISSTIIGDNLLGMDVAPNGNEIAIADDTLVDDEVMVRFLDTATNEISDLFIPAAFNETGTYSVAYTADGNLITTSTFGGSGWVPMRHIELASGDIIFEQSVRQSTMMAVNADRSLVAYAEANSSGGPFGIYEPASTTVLYSGGVSSFTYEIAISKDGSDLAIPTYQGLRVHDSTGTHVFTEPASSYGPPVGVAYNPVTNRLYAAWAGTNLIGIYDTSDYTLIENREIPHHFSWTGNWGLGNGRIKVSNDGKQLFVKVADGIYTFKL